MIKGIDDIESDKKKGEIGEELMIDAIGNLALKLPYMLYHHNEKEVLTKLKQLVDILYKKYVGDIKP